MIFIKKCFLVLPNMELTLMSSTNYEYTGVSNRTQLQNNLLFYENDLIRTEFDLS